MGPRQVGPIDAVTVTYCSYIMALQAKEIILLTKTAARAVAAEHL